MIIRGRKRKAFMYIGIIASIAIVIALVAAYTNQYSPYVCSGEPVIFLYGEEHGDEKQLEKEIVAGVILQTNFI